MIIIWSIRRRILFVEEFKFKGLGDFPREKRKIANSTDWGVYFSEAEPKNFVMYDRKFYTYMLLLKIQHEVLKGKYLCYAVEDIALMRPRLNVVSAIARVRIIYVEGALARGGFPNLWEREYIKYLEVRAWKLSRIKLPSLYISLIMLLGFFYCFLGVAVFTIVVLLAERLSDPIIRLGWRISFKIILTHSRLKFEIRIKLMKAKCKVAFVKGVNLTRFMCCFTCRTCTN